jgi:Tn3 transposase DDE domain
MRVVADLCAVDLRSSHQFEDEIGAASSENSLFFPKTEFSV